MAKQELMLTLSNLFFRSGVLRYKAKLITFGMLFIVLSAILIFELQLKASLNREINENQKINLNEVSSELAKKLSQYTRQLTFLHATPPVAGLAEAFYETGPDARVSFQQWQEQLQSIFTAFLENNWEYNQLRIILNNEEGMELIKVERKDSIIHVVPPDRLQSKAHRDYYPASVQFPHPVAHIFPIVLNQEFGEIEIPYHPTIHVSIPIFGPHGERFGFMIGNINARLLLRSLTALLGPDQPLIITDPDGYFIIHYDKNVEYSKDLHTSHRWQNYFIDEPTPIPNLTISRAIGDNSVYTASTQRVTFNTNKDTGYMTLALLAPESTYNALANDRRLVFYATIGMCVVLFSAIIRVLYRSSQRNFFLAESRAEAHAIVSGSKDAIIGINAQGLITSCNATAEQIFALSFPHIKNKHINEIDLPIATDDIMKTLEHPKNITDIECELAAKNHRTAKTLVCTLAPIIVRGIHTGTALIFNDVTLERQALRKNARINDELEAKISQRTKELQIAQEKALKSSDIKSRFISTISHEMRTPLNGIVSAITLLKKHLRQQDLSRFIEILATSTNSLNVLINDILDLSKIEAGKLELSPRYFNPLGLVEGVVKAQGPKAVEKGLELLLDTSQLTLSKIETDPHRLTQIINNLLSNAIKFTESGLITISVMSDIDELNTAVLHFTVTDTGIGVAEHEQQKLFKNFSQASENISSKYGGSGLGLAICQELVQLMDGNISLTSKENQGTQVSFYIKSYGWENHSFQYLSSLIHKTFAVFGSSPTLLELLSKQLTAKGGKVLKSTNIDALLRTHQGQLDHIIIEQSWLDNTQTTALNALIKQQPKLPITLLIQQDSVFRELREIRHNTLALPIVESELMAALLPNTHHGQSATHSGDMLSGTNYSISGLGHKTLLIVDDNDINIEVAAAMLSDFNLTILTANNGQEALTLLNEQNAKNKTIDCILMDCNMPEMDGYTCTAAIRKGHAGAAYQAIPIIAMTANALRGEREKCIAAGMQEFITKPIQYDSFLETLYTWLTQSIDHNKDKKTVTLINDSAKNSTPIWNKPVALQRLMGKETLLKKVCTLFVNSIAAQTEQLKLAITTLETEQVKQLSHSLKGQAGDIGAEKLYEIAAQLEVLAKANDLDEITRVAPTIFPVIEQTQQVLETYINA
jgi:signal transduction histidine kinase/CheY-like chemotaxis protein